jgi:superfamily II DNA or RNA helicase
MAKVKIPLSIDINRSSYNINNYRPRKCYSLEKSLSVYDYISRKYTHRGFIYDEEKHILKIPSNIDINLILDKCASDEEYITEINDYSKIFVKKRIVNKIECKAKPRNKIQQEAVDFIIAKDVSDKHKSHRILRLATGFGKTVVSIIAAIKLQIPTVIISVNLSKQWIDRLTSFTSGKLGKEIIHIKTVSDIDKLLEMETVDSNFGIFFILGLDAANAVLRNDIDKLHAFYEKFGIGLQIFDEFHLHFLKILNVLVNTTVERVLYLSATPSRSDKAQRYLFKKLFTSNIPMYGEHTLSMNKYNIISINYKTNPDFDDLAKIETRRGIHAINYFKYMFEDYKRYFIIIDIIMFFTRKILKKYPNKKIIIYIQSLKGIRIIKKALQDHLRIGDFKPTIGDYSGNVNKKVRHLELENNIILSTLANTTGVDIKDLIMVINFIPFSSPIIIKQLPGRLREKTSWYVDITDTGFEGMIRQKHIRMINHKKNMKSLMFFEYDNKTRSLNKSFT